MKKSGSMWRVAVGIATVAVLSAAVAACGGGSTGSASGGGSSASTIVGAGASFPAPIYTKWGADYSGVAGVKLNYQSIGSGGGISAIEAKTVQFGASDAPLAEADLQSSGLAQFPMVMGGVVPVVNLDGRVRRPDEAYRRRAGRHLHGQDHHLERPGHQEPQPRPQPAGDEDQRGAPLGRLGHHLDLHALSDRRGSHGVDGRRRQGRQLAGGRGRQGQRGRRRQRAAAQRLHRLRGVRLRQADRAWPRCSFRTRPAPR